MAGPFEKQSGQKDKAGPEAKLSVLDWRGSDAELLERARRGGQVAAALLYDRFAVDVNRLVRRILGPDADHDDLVQEVFIKVLKGVHRVKEGSKLRSWVLSVAANTVNSELRRRSLRRRFHWSTESTEDLSTVEEDPEGRALVKRTFAVLDRMPPKERMAFSIRYIDQQPLPKVAELCNCSLATIKRRLKKAQKYFVALARRDPSLAERLREGRWEVD